MAEMVAFDPGTVQPLPGELAELVATHCTPGVRTGQEGSLSSNPAHDPAVGQITDVDEDTATVRSVIQTARNHSRYHEYRLLRGDDGWRISQLSAFFDPPGTPLVDPAQAEALMQSASLPERRPALTIRNGSNRVRRTDCKTTKRPLSAFWSVSRPLHESCVFLRISCLSSVPVATNNHHEPMVFDG
ncbi:hypothetical protein [Arthrobacter sp. ISL-30]|uniref:hypothetical protein n=1 Tax=Arthrobacter sp. ISL-30 TaxID=2819109 RepID=UPI001BEC1E39|nr:hypothetical protein [Arthrobacter sp. ISL-30]MBT2512272.1 hypothetical protein [Arthrobacter sp. ISL-30]